MNELNQLIFRRKNLQATLLLLGSYMCLLVLGACIDNVDTDPFGECPNRRQKSNLTDIAILYEPYKNGKYSTELDEVSFKEFKITLKLTFEQISQSSFSANFPGNAYALSCLALYDVRNVSNIAIILSTPYEGIATGTDISYLFLVQNNLRLSEFRDFSEVPNFLSLTLSKAPATKTQLKTQTIVFFKNGTQKLLESTSPTLLIN